MKIGIILTGALRTITKTILYVKRNIIDALQSTHSYSFYLCVQNDTAHSNSYWDDWFHSQLPFIYSIKWYTPEQYPEFIQHRDNTLLSGLSLDIVWKDYLKHSGSMIEYFQLQLAYIQLCNHEQHSGIACDYIIRLRTDSIFTKPIDFHWLNWTDDDVSVRIQSVKQAIPDNLIQNKTHTILTYFMSSIISDDILPNIPSIWAEYCPYPHISSDVYGIESDTMLSDMVITSSELNDYIKRGRYILTFRKNNLYIVKRGFFNLIPSLGTMYGYLKGPYSDAYWFNAECQFQSACYYSGLTIHDYSSDFENKSLEYARNWNESMFFDSDYNPVNPYMLYCVVRS
jgi:hypothetical protein